MLPTSAELLKALPTLRFLTSCHALYSFVTVVSSRTAWYTLQSEIANVSDPYVLSQLSCTWEDLWERQAGRQRALPQPSPDLGTLGWLPSLTHQAFVPSSASCGRWLSWGGVTLSGVAILPSVVPVSMPVKESIPWLHGDE